MAFGIFQIPAAIWYGAQSAFSQTMPLTTKAYSDAFLFTRLYAFIGLLVFLMLLGDAICKMFRQYYLMMNGRLRPWGCVRRFMGVTEISIDPDAAHDDVVRIQVPLTGFSAQIVTMFFLDASLAFVLAIFWLAWIPFLLVLMPITWKQPQSYYTHLQAIRNRYEGVPRVSRRAAGKAEEDNDSQ